MKICSERIDIVCRQVATFRETSKLRKSGKSAEEICKDFCKLNCIYVLKCEKSL